MPGLTDRLEDVLKVRLEDRIIVMLIGMMTKQR